MLDVKSINTFYGLSHILFDLSITVSKGEVVGLLGRNGAGEKHDYAEYYGAHSS